MDKIKDLMKSGDVKRAAEALKKLVEAEPENVEAMMLYGTCCHLMGDDETFRKIHDELAPKMEREKDEKRLSLWRKYRAIWLTLLGATLVIAVGGYYVGNDILNMFGTASPAVAAYMGPGYYDTNDVMRVNDIDNAVRSWKIKTRHDEKE